MNSNPMSMNTSWGGYPFPGKDPLTCRIGPLTIWCRSVAEELWLAFLYVDPDQEAPVQETVPEELTWSRWALQERYDTIRLTPVFPDRPVVVKPEHPFYLGTEGGRATIYVRVPLTVSVELSHPVRPVVLTEIPTVILSDTWFGTFTHGELCYWISTGARRTLESDPLRPHQAVCPIRLKNDSREDLKVEKLCLHVDHLSLFDYQGQLMADETKISYRGVDDITQIDVSGEAPVTGAGLVTPPRTPQKQSFNARSFLSFVSLSGG